jgi:carbon monoxide dehydrogenase subunit G
VFTVVAVIDDVARVFRCFPGPLCGSLSTAGNTSSTDPQLYRLIQAALVAL